jgi:hypothetical protein
MGITGDLFLDFHYWSIIVASLVPLYFWYVRKEQDSVVLKVCRGVRLVNALFYAAAFFLALELFWEELELGMPLLIALPIITYLLARRWAPKKREMLIDA